MYCYKDKSYKVIKLSSATYVNKSNEVFFTKLSCALNSSEVVDFDENLFPLLSKLDS